MTGLFAAQAHEFASSNRQMHADLLIGNAVRESVAAFRVAAALERQGMATAREGLLELVSSELERAGQAAARILGPGVDEEVAS